MKKQKMILLVSACPEEDDLFSEAFAVLCSVFSEKEIPFRCVCLPSDIQGCTACGKCNRIKRCVHEDIVNETAGNSDAYSALIFAAPVQYGDISSNASAFLTRLFRSASPAFRGLIAAAILGGRTRNAHTALNTVYGWFATADMLIVTSSASAPVHASLTDAEKENMRILAERICWLIRCTEAAGNSGDPPPQYALAKMTDFVR